MAAMQWTRDGLVPVGGLLQVVPPQEEKQEATPSKKLATAKEVQHEKQLNVVALARQRLKELKKELKRMKTLEKEKLELEALLAAVGKKTSRASTRGEKNRG